MVKIQTQKKIFAHLRKFVWKIGFMRTSAILYKKMKNAFLL